MLKDVKNLIKNSGLLLIFAGHLW